MPHNGCGCIRRRRNDIKTGARPACCEAIRTIIQIQRGTMIIPNDFIIIQENIAKSIALSKIKKKPTVVISRVLCCATTLQSLTKQYCRSLSRIFVFVTTTYEF